MKKHVKKALQNPLIYGSSIVVIGNLFANFFNFLFNFFMLRSLSVAEYGVLASIISIISFPSLLANAVNPVVIRFAGDYFVQNKLEAIKGLYLKFSKFFLIVGIGVFILFLLVIGPIANFFNIKDTFILILADLIIFMTLISIVNAAFLQAKLAFGFLVSMNTTGMAIKLLLAIVFIFFGFKVAGGVGAILAGAVAQYIVSFFPLRNVFENKMASPKIDIKEIIKYGIPSSLTLIALTSFLSADILLAKHFFSPEQAGLYAGLSLLGRIIFFITLPIGGVMFPIIIRQQSKQENTGNTYKLALLMVVLPSVIITAIYFIIPDFIILLFLKQQVYLQIAPYAGFFGIYITLYCLLYLIATFYLSIKKTRVYLPLLIGAILQIILISIFHNSFVQLIMISFSIILVLTIGFLIYYPFAMKNTKLKNLPENKNTFT